MKFCSQGTQRMDQTRGKSFSVKTLHVYRDGGEKAHEQKVVIKMQHKRRLT